MRFVDMFCGMGTIRMGFEQAGHECVYSIEWDKHKRKIYEVIFGKEPEASDITTVRASDIPRSDCWCFGAPCQDFSVAGLRAGLDGNRSGLVREVFRLVREKEPANRPVWLLYENVKGVLSSNNGWDFAAIQAEMGGLGYDVQWQLLNSKDFGVPQNRERVYTLGHLRARGQRKVFPISGQSNEYSTVGKSAETAVARTLTAGGHSGGNHSGMTILRWQNKKQGVVESDFVPALRASSGTDIRKSPVVKTLNTKNTDGKEPYQQNRIYLQNGIMTTLSSQLSGRLNIKHHDLYRRMTPREWMRCQGVPDYITDKLIAAKISDTQMYRAAGDACSVPVIYEIAKRMEESI